MSNQIVNFTRNSSAFSQPRFETNAIRTISETRTPQLAANQITTYHWTLDEELAAYRRLGFSAIGVWRQKLDAYGEPDGIARIRQSGMDVTSLSWAGGFSGSTGFTFREAIDDARDAICTAARLRAGSLLIASGARAGHIKSHARRLLVQAMNELAHEAAERRVTLAIAPLSAPDSPWSFLRSIEDTLEVIDRCNHPAVRMCFNVYHLWREDRLLDRIPEIVRHVSLIQLSDWRQPAGDYDRHRLGDGEIPLREIVQAFLAAGYAGAFEVDIWSEALWNSDYEQLLRHSHDQFQSMWSPEYSEPTLSH